jgi:hypothetical protein
LETLSRSIQNAFTSTRCAGSSLSHANGISPGSTPSVARPAGMRRLRGSGGSTPVHGAGTSRGRRFWSYGSRFQM